MTELEYHSRRFRYNGISWTLKEDVARFFAFTYQRNFLTAKMKKVVVKIQVKKKDILAFFNGREEFEVIYLKPILEAEIIASQEEKEAI